MSIESATVVSDNPQPPWTVGTGTFDRVRVSVGEVTPDYYPGGGVNYGAFSALTGTLALPAESDQAVDASGNPLIIISAAVSGLVQTKGTKNVAVALFGNARVNADQGRVWGANLVTANFPSSSTHPQYGRPAQINGLEIDCTWQATQNPTSGSNQIAIWIPADFHGGRPDGAADAIRIGRYGDLTSFPHKNFLSADHGSADRFAQLCMTKHPEAEGASGSQGLYWITSTGGQKTTNETTGVVTDSNQYHHSYLEISSGGDFIFQPDKFGGTGNVIVANSDLSQAHSIHPVNGFSGARATLGTLGVTGSASVSGTLSTGAISTGNLNVSGSVGVGGALTVNGSATTFNLYTGGIACSGNGAFGSLTYQGLAVQLSPPGSIPGNAKALIVVP